MMSKKFALENFKIYIIVWKLFQQIIDVITRNLFKIYIIVWKRVDIPVITNSDGTL